MSYFDRIRVRKNNPYHDELGRFTSAENDAGGPQEIAGIWEPASGDTQTHTFDGGFMRDENGKLWYVKQGGDDEHLRVEQASNMLYRAAGIRVAPTKLVTMHGSLRLASAAVEGARPADRSALPSHSDVKAGFAVDAWLGAWDVAGMDYSNILQDAAGNVVRLDHGGTLHRRAQGATKSPSQWGAEVTELRSLRDMGMNPTTARMFSGMSNDDVRASVRRVTSISDGQIDNAIRQAGLRQETADILRARRDWMRDQFGA